MDQRPRHIEYLWRQYIAGKASPEEVAALFERNKEQDNDEAQSTLVEQILSEYKAQNLADNEVSTRILQEILTKKQEENPLARPIPLLRRWWVAAAVVLIIATGSFFWFFNKEQPLITANKHLQEDVAPGKEGAILTLADGSQVVLDSLGEGWVADQNGAEVILKAGQIAYTATGNATGKIMYNTMTTPQGRQYQVTLPDGTKVWLNAASSLRYPTVFTEKERTVFVTGEAYFEVAQNVKTPFRVNINDIAEVEVLGTSFNINAYENEKSLNTTLLEGAVRVRTLWNEPAPLSSRGNEGSFAFAQDDKKTTPDEKRSALNSRSAIIQPGQQAQVRMNGAAADHPSNAADQLQVVNVKDVDKVMAWKNGFINFEEATLDEIMRQLERWYGIQVIYEKGIPAIRFFGKMSRNLSLERVLKGLEDMGVRFKLKGRILTVTE